MTPLFRKGGSLLSGFIILIFISRGIGFARASSPFADLFTSPDGTPCIAPCMFGIRLEHTTYDEAVMLLRAHPLTRNLQVGRGSTFTGDGIQLLLGQDDNQIVTQIQIQFKVPGNPGNSPLRVVSLGDSIAALGSPSFVRLDTILVDRTPISYWFYRDRWLVVIIEHRDCTIGPCSMQDTDSLQTNDHIIGLGMGAYVKDPPSQRVKIAGWHGFTALRRYAQCRGTGIYVDCTRSIGFAP